MAMTQEHTRREAQALMTVLNTPSSAAHVRHFVRADAALRRNAGDLVESITHAVTLRRDAARYNG